ncbi:MAG: cell division FtsZ family protein [Candidatus Omnitrophica bacterium]|nr:cell division FtsZ family protein [Candidatus Omnitrophota bacterium]
MVNVIEENSENSVKIRVVGVGNAGCSIITRIFDHIQGVDFIAINTDGNSLKFNKAHVKIHIGEKTTGGGGTGRDPEKGKFAANEDRTKIEDVVKNSGIVFLVAGLGGGTGTGSSPVVARIAKDLQSIVIALVVTPFAFEGLKKMEQARNGLEVLEKNVDTLIYLSNQRLAEIVDKSTAMTQAFAKVDEVVSRTVSSLSDLINKTNPTLIDIDYADICAMVNDAGRGIVGL